MGATTEYGYWADHSKQHTELRDDVIDFLGGQTHEFDVDGLVEAYEDAINEALPEDIALRGRNFYGPFPRREGSYDEIHAAIDSVDLGALAERHERIELWTIQQVAEYWGVTESRARHILANNNVRSGYDPERVKAIPRPGQGARTDLKRKP